MESTQVHFRGDKKWLSSVDLKFLPSGSRQRIGWLYVAGILTFGHLHHFADWHLVLDVSVAVTSSIFLSDHHHWRPQAAVLMAEDVLAQCLQMAGIPLMNYLTY